MKKPLSIILTIILAISVVGNITLYIRLNKMNSENQDLNNSVVEIQDSISNLENQLSEVQADLSDTNTKNEELQSGNESLQSEIESLQTELEKLQATGLEETSVNNNNDSQSGSDVASEVQEPAQSNQASQEQEDSDNNQSSTITQEKVQEVLTDLFGPSNGTNAFGNGQGMRGDY